MRRLPGLGAKGASASGVTFGAGRAFKGFAFIPGPNPSNRINFTNFRHMNGTPQYYVAVQQIQDPARQAGRDNRPLHASKISRNFYQKPIFRGTSGRCPGYLRHGLFHRRAQPAESAVGGGQTAPPGGGHAVPGRPLALSDGGGSAGEARPLAGRRAARRPSRGDYRTPAAPAGGPGHLTNRINSIVSH